MTFNHIAFIEEVVRDYYASIENIETIFDIHYKRVFGNNSSQDNARILQEIMGYENITEIKIYDFLFFKIEDILNDNYESDAETEDEKDD